MLGRVITLVLVALAVGAAASAQDVRMPEIEFGRYHALVIGNNDYQHLRNLATAVGDADAVATLLEEKYGFQVTKLINATRRDITGAQRDAMAKAYIHWHNGNVLHLAGRYEEAAALFQRSIDAYPTAEGHTFLGWSLSELGRFEDAIAECKKAISLDSDYGNPYNDIGVYLIELGQPDEAVPWLRKAITAKRYCCYEFAHSNLGRVLLSQGKIDEAKRSFERALSHNPDYVPAIVGLEKIRENWGEDI